MTAQTPDALLEFWFANARDDAIAHAARNAVWFNPDPSFDQTLRERFSELLVRAQAGELKRWKLSAAGTLALIVLFDQIPRNIFRATAQAFACDARALALARDGVAMGIDQDLSISERMFFYLPFEHAEDREAQVKSIDCFTRLHADTDAPFRPLTAAALHHAQTHHDLIARFGRFPHRNLILDRNSRPEEIAWLGAHGGSFGQA